MFIQTEDTPNPNVMKFLPGQTLLDSPHPYEFKSDQEAENSPLATRLFSLGFVTNVFISKDFVSVTKDETVDWQSAKALVLGALMDHLTASHPIILTEKSDNSLVEEDANTAYTEAEKEIVAQIRELLDSRIRPAVAVDGGDITFVRYEKGVVYLKLQGACSGCPSSTITLKSGIENMLRHYIPEVTDVCSIDEKD